MLNRKGFSLALVLVSIVVVTGVGAVIAQMIEDMLRSDTFMRRRLAANFIQLKVANMLQDPTVCEYNFKNVSTNPATPPTVTSIVSSSGATPTGLVKQGDAVENGLLTVSQITLGDFQPNETSGNDALHGTMDLSIALVPANGDPGIALVRSILIAVELNSYPPVVAGAPDQIKTCWAIGTDPNNTWRLASNADIYYTVGNVGIGTSAPSALLTVAGNVLATNYLHSSDRRLKHSIEPAHGLSFIRGLSGVRFKWRSSGQPGGGLLAQQVEALVPSAVVTDRQSGLKAVDSSQLIAPVVESLKELSRRQKTLEAELNEAEDELARLKAARTR